MEALAYGRRRRLPAVPVRHPVQDAAKVPSSASSAASPALRTPLQPLPLKQNSTGVPSSPLPVSADLSAPPEPALAEPCVDSTADCLHSTTPPRAEASSASSSASDPHEANKPPTGPVSSPAGRSIAGVRALLSKARIVQQAKQSKSVVNNTNAATSARQNGGAKQQEFVAVGVRAWGVHEEGTRLRTATLSSRGVAGEEETRAETCAPPASASLQLDDRAHPLETRAGSGAGDAHSPAPSSSRSPPLGNRAGSGVNHELGAVSSSGSLTPSLDPTRARSTPSDTSRKAAPGQGARPSTASSANTDQTRPRAASTRPRLVLSSDSEGHSSEDELGQEDRPRSRGTKAAANADSSANRQAFFSAQGKLAQEALNRAQHLHQRRQDALPNSSLPANLPFLLEQLPPSRPQAGDNEAVASGKTDIGPQKTVIAVIMRLSSNDGPSALTERSDVMATLRKLAEIGFSYGKNYLRRQESEMVVLTYIQVASALVPIDKWPAFDAAIFPMQHQGWAYATARHAVDHHVLITPTAAGVDLHGWLAPFQSALASDQEFQVPDAAQVAIIYQRSDSPTITRIMHKSAAQIRRALRLSAAADDDLIQDAELDFLINDLIIAHRIRVRRRKLSSKGATGGPASLSVAMSRNTKLIGRYRGTNKSISQDVKAALKRLRPNPAPSSQTPAATGPPRAQIWSCDECDKKFSKLRDLEPHRPVHEEERYPCPDSTCTKDFGNPGSLATHYKEIHLLRPLGVKWICPHCKVERLGRNVFKKHMELKHKDKRKLATLQERLVELGKAHEYDPPTEKEIRDMSETKRLLGGRTVREARQNASQKSNARQISNRPASGSSSSSASSARRRRPPVIHSSPEASDDGGGGDNDEGDDGDDDDADSDSYDNDEDDEPRPKKARINGRQPGSTAGP